MSSYKKLIKNTMLFAIGSLGSTVISILLVPLYTYYLSANEYGIIDLLITTVTMLIPIVSGSIFDALLRYVMDKSNNSSEILGTSLLVAGVGYGIFIITYPLLLLINIFNSFLMYLYLLLLVQITQTILAQYTRAINEVRIYSINGILLTFTTGILNVFFLVGFKTGVSGYFLSVLLANIISVIFLFFSTDAKYALRIKSINLTLIKEMLCYSLPMIPNSLMWWMINASSRYFIRFFVGAAGNGLFAVASKIPMIINLINQVFNQAWQMSAIEEYESKNKSKFYSEIFNSLSAIMFVGTSGVIVILKSLFYYLFATEYYQSWQSVPFLLLGSVFSAFSGFFGTNYIAAKETRGVFKTSFYGGVISLISNILIIPTFGLIGAGISSTLSFFVMFFLRYLDTKKYIEMVINWRALILNVCIVLLQITILFIDIPHTIEIVANIFLFFSILILNNWIFKIVLVYLKNIVNRKTK